VGGGVRIRHQLARATLRVEAAVRTLLLVLVLGMTPSAWAKKAELPPSWYASESSKEAASSASSLLMQHKYTEAATAYEAILVTEPGCGVALLGAGKARLGEGKPGDAVAPLQKASTLYADKAEVWIVYGQALEGAQRYGEAVDAAKHALALKPTSADAQWVAQQSLMAQKDYAGAHALLAEARTKGWMVVLDCMDGLVYVSEGDVAHASEMQAKCRDFHPWSDQLAVGVSAMAGSTTAAAAPASGPVVTVPATAPPTP
jgi:tetratricopeptide (TPR) repeat protein